MWLDSDSDIFFVYALVTSYEHKELKAVHDLEKLYRTDHTYYKVIVGNSNSKIDSRRRAEGLHVRTHGMEQNEQGERLFEFTMSSHITYGSSLWTWQPPGGQFYIRANHNIFNRRYCTTGVAVAL
ncbi:unnamed protein product [Haemonchus placei]|uniref:GIY-YIG domain-containing protein n=1 Tax=Haemonchus placei TaxID=6290 RepID=A0A0N4WFH4_HAEPC|nr:unnamed protein product [Haemonchus placei]